jgi:hypothetical protein
MRVLIEAYTKHREIAHPLAKRTCTRHGRCIDPPKRRLLHDTRSSAQDTGQSSTSSPRTRSTVSLVALTCLCLRSRAAQPSPQLSQRASPRSSDIQSCSTPSKNRPSVFPRQLRVRTNSNIACSSGLCILCRMRSTCPSSMAIAESTSSLVCQPARTLVRNQSCPTGCPRVERA